MSDSSSPPTTQDREPMKADLKNALDDYETSVADFLEDPRTEYVMKDNRRRVEALIRKLEEEARDQGPDSEPKDCDCAGLWNDSSIRLGPESRDVYNRTGHLPNCQRASPPLPPTSEPIHDENCDALRSGSDMLEGILRACNCRPIPATSEPIPASSGKSDKSDLRITPHRSDFKVTLDAWQQSIEEATRNCRNPLNFKILCDVRDKRRAAVEELFSAQQKQLPPASDQLREALRDFQAEVVDWILHCHGRVTSSPPDSVVTARAAVEEQFAEQQEQAEDYYQVGLEFNKTALRLEAELASLRVENERLRDDGERLKQSRRAVEKSFLAAKSELASLRSSSLTAEEADHIYNILAKDLRYEKACRPELIAKLSALRSSTADKGNTK